VNADGDFIREIRRIRDWLVPTLQAEELTVDDLADSILNAAESVRSAKRERSNRIWGDYIARSD
jgi:hypothetical protein